MRALDFVIMGFPIGVLIGTEVARSIVHRRRERRDGIAGTQDIAFWGTMVFLVTLLVSIGWLIWRRTR